jgi:metal-responsive CopG/Arc/MetJ family transcriptional regulator
MSARKTFSLPEDLARAIEREAARQGTPESAVAREAFQEYLASRSTSKLARWVGKGRSTKDIKDIDHEGLHEEIVQILEDRSDAEHRT